ncbi:Hypothetical protein NF53_p3064 (plasmid) [Bacillus thuringiensis serovar indiana]|nr:Hypothetical protein NF53_p3064 [Bacillus thuringiensis serovar indiana]
MAIPRDNAKFSTPKKVKCINKAWYKKHMLGNSLKKL